MKKLPKTIGSLRVDGQNPEWNDPKYIIVPNPDGVVLGNGGRDWQKKAYEQLKDERFSFIAAFCGSGKSVVLVALGVHDVVASNYTQKQLIVVPQSHIHKGFVADGDLNYIPIIIDGEKYEWKINDNFCDASSKDVLKNLKKWLLTDGKTLAGKHKDHLIMGLNCVTSHMALDLVWKSLTPDEKEQAIDHLTLRADEGHHIKGVFDIEENEENGGLSDIAKQLLEQESTGLGEICRFMFNSKNETAKICIATATPYRGDKGIILSKTVQEKFNIYYLDWIEHFKSLGIEKFYLEYEEYVGDPIKQVVAKIAAEPKEKHMIVIPSTTRKWRQDGKKELQKLLREIHKIVPKERVLDLVTPNTQNKNKEKLLEEPKAKGKGMPKSKFDVVVTCMLGREGTDWCPCSRLHNTACEGSITLAIQTIGRPFRRFKGKREVYIYYYVHQFPKPKNGMTKRELLTDRTNALLVCMQLDDMCNPIIIPIIPNGEENEGKTEGEGGGESTSLSEIFGDQYQQMKKDLLEEIGLMEKVGEENINELIDDIVDEYEITENLENIKKALAELIYREIIRANPQLTDLGIDVEFLRENGFDKISEDIDIKNIYFGDYNKKDWKIIRDIVRTYDRIFKENVAKIIEIGIKNVEELKKQGVYQFALRQRLICNKEG